jgi:MFS family permease
LKVRDASSRRNLLIGTGEGVLAMPWNYLSLPGNFVIAALLTQYYGLGKATYGLLVSLPLWSNAAQIVVLPWLARFLTPKDLALGMGWLNIGMWTMLAAVLPYLPTDDATGVARLFVVFFVVASLSQAFLGVGWTSWVRVWVPSKLRGKYFGARNRWLNAGTLAFLVLVLALFEADETALWPYQVLIVVAVLARYGSLIWQHGIRTTTEHLDVVGQGWVEQLRRNLAAPGLLRFIVFAAWTSFWMAFAGPFVPVFSFEELGVAPGTFTILVILATGSGIFGWWFWGKKVDRHGCLAVLVIGLGVWALQDYLWAVLSRETVWLLYPMWLFGGFVSVAYFAASFNLLLKLVPASAKVTGVSLHLALTSLAAAVAPILAGLLLAHFLAAGGGITVYRVGFVLKSTAILAGIFLLRGIREPQRTTQPTLTGAFRTVRQLVAAQGASFLGRGG